PNLSGTVAPAGPGDGPGPAGEAREGRWGDWLPVPGHVRTREHVRPVQHGDTGLVQVALHRAAAEGQSGTLEPDLVPRLGVADVDLPGDRIGPPCRRALPAGPPTCPSRCRTSRSAPPRDPGCPRSSCSAPAARRGTGGARRTATPRRRRRTRRP